MLHPRVNNMENSHITPVILWVAVGNTLNQFNLSYHGSRGSKGQCENGRIINEHATNAHIRVNQIL